MTTIADLSDKPEYTIKKVSLKTGIPAITLRAWERRYALPAPQRSGNRYRLYSERDIATLRWLKEQLVRGSTISTAVNELQALTNRGVWPEVYEDWAEPQKVKSDVDPAGFANSLYRALVQHDEPAAENTLNEAMAIFDLQTILTKIITPCLIRIGEAWFRGEIRIATEHFASTFLRGRLLATLQRFPQRRDAPLLHIGGAPTELHEIGALMIAVLLRQQGYRVDYLGPDLPLDDLVDHARYEKPAMIILTATTRAAALELTRMHEKISRLRPTPCFGYGGAAFNVYPDLRRQIAGEYLGDTLDLAIARVGELVQR